MGNGRDISKDKLGRSLLGDAVASGLVAASLYGAGTASARCASAGATASFLVLATDQAGNVEAAPDGLSLPIYNSGVNLGALPLALPSEPSACLPLLS